MVKGVAANGRGNQFSDERKKALARGQTRALAGLVDRAVKPIFQKRGLVDVQIATRWHEIVGSELARLSAPERVSFQGKERKGGTLHLAVKSGSLAIELQHLESQLVERVNRFFGYGAVGRIKIRQTLGSLPKPPAPPKTIQPDVHHIRQAEAACGGIGDPALKERLGRLGALIAKRRAGS